MLIQADALHLPLATKSVDAIVTSPPYYGCFDYGSKTAFRNGKYALGAEPVPAMYARHIAEALGDCYRVLKDDGILWLVLGDYDDAVPISMAPQRAALELVEEGWIVAQEIHWVKRFNVTRSGAYFGQPNPYTEKIYMLVKSHKYNYSEGRWPRNRMKHGNVWEMPPAISKGSVLFAELPEVLPEKCIMASTQKGDIVLDPFVGRGVVIKVAERLGRVGVGCDLSIVG